MKYKWKVSFTNTSAKQARKLGMREQEKLKALLIDLRISGPIRPNWPNYSKLDKKNHHHCHLSYKWVACWRLEDDDLKLIDIYYVGSRENAPY